MNIKKVTSTHKEEKKLERFLKLQPSQLRNYQSNDNPRFVES